MTSHRSFGLILVLVLLTLAGHVCELPLGALASAHAHGHGHAAEDHSADHHHDDSAIACDAVPGVQRSADAGFGGGVDVHPQSHPVGAAVASRAAGITLKESDPVPRGLPLFLLHAALLI